MTKNEFVYEFVRNFIATWCANNYERCCANNSHSMLYNPPIEDAIYIAEQVWEKYDGS